LNREEIARLIDHTLLKPEATLAQVAQLCDEARRYGFATVCINPVYVRFATEKLQGSGVDVCTVVGFPLGATTTEAKVCEARQAVADGATEIDMVLHVGALKAGDHEAAQDDIAAVALACHEGGALLKVIIEAVLLNDEEKVAACRLAQTAGADFVKTSTGFARPSTGSGHGGATVEDVRLMRQTVGQQMGVKAAGGIRSYADALAMIEAGANRIGASASVQIVEQVPERISSG
jgi:deoxyribose-phosphate aldolase